MSLKHWPMRNAASCCGRLSTHVPRGNVLIVFIAGHMMTNVNIPQSSDTSLTFWATCIHVWNNAWLSSGRLMAVTSYGSSIRVFYFSFLVIWDVRLGTRFGVLTAVLLRFHFCWDVALCCWWAVGMWHCVDGELLGSHPM